MTASPVVRSRVQRHFSKHAREYEHHAVVQARVIKRLVGLLRERAPFHGPVLDIGCGTGLLTAALRPLCPSSTLVLSDLAHGMTCQARLRLPDSLALDADGCALALAAERFSLVCSSSVYQWVDNLEKAFGEACRVLMPGGVFAFALFGEETLFELKNSHHFALSRVGDGRVSHFQTFPSLKAVRAAMEKKDFHSLNLFEELEVEYHPDVSRLLRSLKGIGAQNASADRPGGLASRRIMQCMTEHYTVQHGGKEGIPATYHVVYGLGVKNS